MLSSAGNSNVPFGTEPGMHNRCDFPLNKKMSFSKELFCRLVCIELNVCLEKRGKEERVMAFQAHNISEPLIK